MSDLQASKSDSTLVLSETEWKPLKIPGISMKVLHLFPEGGSTVMIRMEPGSSFPVHEHNDDEETFVLEGDIRVGKFVLRQGDYLYTPPGVIHASQTKKGCTLLATSRKPLKLLK